MSIEIRALSAGEAADFVRAQQPAWGEHWSDAKVASFAGAVEPERSLVALEGGRMVGFTAVFTSGVGLPGGHVPAAAVTGVGVLPSHRRRGVLRDLMLHQLEGLRDGGEPVAMLGASESAIYRRFGYGVASYGERIEIETRRAAFRRPAAAHGRLELVDHAAFLAAVPRVYRRLTAGVPGAIDRPPGYWRAHTADPDGRSAPFGPRHYVLLHGDGAVDGYLMYRVHARWTPNALADYRLSVEEMLAAPGAADQTLWRFCLDHDLVSRVIGYRRPVDDPLRHHLADPRRLQRMPIDDLWLRPVDVPALLEARRYPVPGGLTLEVHDDVCPWVAGSYRLEGTPDGARCTAGGGGGDLALDAAALGSILLGGVSPSALGAAGLVEERTPGALARATAMFGWHRAPWNLGEY